METYETFKTNQKARIAADEQSKTRGDDEHIYVVSIPTCNGYRRQPAIVLEENYSKFMEDNPLATVETCQNGRHARLGFFISGN